ncbi:hypothetical protein ACFQ6U_25265 [Streptomyces sp. NPDC056465]
MAPALVREEHAAAASRLIAHGQVPVGAEDRAAGGSGGPLPPSTPAGA